MRCIDCALVRRLAPLLLMLALTNDRALLSELFDAIAEVRRPMDQPASEVDPAEPGEVEPADVDA